MMTIMSRDPADSYRALLTDVRQLAGRSRRQSHREASVHGSTAARWQTMSAIADNDLTVAAIARRLGLPRQAVHRVVDDLITQGHVQERPNPDHARSDLISLTATGRSLLRKLSRESERHHRELLKTAKVSDHDLAVAHDVLRRILDTFTSSDA
jgi:DNA-binding MarR family transcriptional regulator